jgi:hypothetical protein
MASLILSGGTSGTVTVSAPSIAGTQGYILPTALPTANGQTLTATTAGIMSWSTVSAIPGGSTNQVQYNSASVFTGSSNFIFENGNTVGVGGLSTPSSYGDGANGFVAYSSTANGRGHISLGGNTTSADEAMGKIHFFNSNSTNAIYRICAIQAARGADNNSGYLTFQTSSSGAPSERVRIDTIGCVSIGTTSAGTARFRINHSATDQYGIYVPGNIYTGTGYAGNNYGGFFCSNTSNSGTTNAYGVYATIAGGPAVTGYGGYFDGQGDPTNTRIGVYGTAKQSDLNGPGTAYGGWFNANTVSAGAGTLGSTVAVRAENTATIGGYAFSVRASTVAGPSNIYGYVYLHAGADVFRVKSNGGIDNYSANNTNLSDLREKKNIAMAGGYLDKLCAIPVKTFLYINDSDNEDLNLGVIAQDVQTVAPELITEDAWPTEDEPDRKRLVVYQTDMQYAMMRAIQELKALIDAQALRIAQLEAK